MSNTMYQQLNFMEQSEIHFVKGIKKQLTCIISKQMFLKFQNKTILKISGLGSITLKCN